MHINELHDLLNAMEQAGFTQRERNNERFRGIAQRLLAAHSAGAQAFAYSTVEHWLTEAAGEREVGHVVQEMTHMEVARQAFAAGRALSAGAQEPVGYLPAYELERLQSGHDANLRSAKFGASHLDGDVAIYLAQPQPMTADKEVRYQKVCAAAYQLAGLVDAPLRFLDALSDASNGEPMEDAIDLLPVTQDECGLMTDAAEVDFEADAKRLALELECLLNDCKDTAIASKWWDSAIEALEQHRTLLAEIERIDRAGEES